MHRRCAVQPHVESIVHMLDNIYVIDTDADAPDENVRMSSRQITCYESPSCSLILSMMSRYATLAGLSGYSSKKLTP